MTQETDNGEKEFINPYNEYHDNVSGQFFIQKPGGIFRKYEIYHWTRYYVKRKDGTYLYPYFIVIEPEELTFYYYEYDEINHAMLKESFLVIPLLDIKSSSFVVERKLRDLFQHEDKTYKSKVGSRNGELIDSTEKMCSRAFPDKTHEMSKKNYPYLFRTFFLDFLWDLYVNQYFDNGGKKYIIKLALSRFPVIEAIKLKLEFYEYIIGYSPYEVQVEGEMPSSNVSSQESEYYEKQINQNVAPLRKNQFNFKKEFSEKQKEIYEQWINFLIQENNEILFVDKKLERSSEHWLKTAEDELIRTMDACQGKKQIGHKHQELLNRRISKYLLKRYNFLDVLKYYSPFGEVSKWIYLGYIVFLFFCIIIDWLYFNLNKDHTPNITMVTSSLIGIFILIPVVAFGFLGIISIIHQFNSNKVVKLKNTLTAIMPKIFLPRMVLAIFSGWLIFFTSEELIKVDFGMSLYSLSAIFIFVILISLIFMFNEVRNNAKSIPSSKVLERVSIVTMLGFIISYSIGYVLMPIVSQSMIDDSSALSNHFIVKEMVIEDIKRMDSLNTELFYLEKVEDAFLKFNSLIFYTQINDVRFGVIHDNNTIITRSAKTADVISFLKTELQNRIIRLDQIIKIDSSNDLTDDIKLYKEYLSAKHAYFHDSVPPHSTMLKMINEIEVSTNKISSITTSRMIHYSKCQYSLKNSIAEKSRAKYVLDKFHNAKDLHYSANDDYFWRFLGAFNTIENDRLIVLNMLIFRAIMAFFIGIFIQLIIQDKSIMESI